MADLDALQKQLNAIAVAAAEIRGDLKRLNARDRGGGDTDTTTGPDERMYLSTIRSMDPHEYARQKEHIHRLEAEGKVLDDISDPQVGRKRMKEITKQATAGTRDPNVMMKRIWGDQS